MKKRLLHILFWSVIAAAFIGPGTVTTAASAGTGFGYSLIWALIFSTAACYVLQEASARITAVSGTNLGRAMQIKYSETHTGKWLILLALISIITGCAAFEAGNILGAVAGISLIFTDVSPAASALIIGGISGALLWKGSVRQIATLLGCIVAVMGICFVFTALLIPQNWGAVFSQGFWPSVPTGSEILVLGLVGTTVVPYNIFLGSGLKHTQTVPEMKLSLLIAIGLGGFVSIAILLTGTAITGSFTFAGLADALSEQIGGWGRWLLGIGLFGAGVSSTLTAALAAAITARSLLSKNEDKKWSDHGILFRSIWVIILATGLFFGVFQFQPVPVIILAQALNGIILPVIAVILYLMMNDRSILPETHQNGIVYNLATGIVVYLTFLIGTTNILRAASRLIEFDLPGQTTIFIVSLILFFLLMIPVLKNIFVKHS